MNPLRWRTTDSGIGRFLLRIKTLLQLAAWHLRHPSPDNRYLARCILKIKPRYTMVTNRNLVCLYRLATELNEQGVTGDLVVCGVWNGGSSALMARATADHPGQIGPRAPWLFDSFQGLPPPGDKDAVTDHQKRLLEGLNHGRVDRVKEVFERLEAPLDTDRIVPGWFNETLEQAPVGDIALLHIDADWYDSVKYVLEQLYDRVVPGGYLVLDDYGYWEGCDRAWEDFCTERKIDLPLERIDVNGAYIRIPAAGEQAGST